MSIDTAQYQCLTFQYTDRILTITLNRPEMLNAVNPQMHKELAKVFTECSDDADTDVVILTGAGKAFSAGGDIKWLRQMHDTPEEFIRAAREGKRIVYSLLDCEKPVIAKVNGAATGLGATIALFCDVIYASTTARIGDPHVNAGLVAGDGGAVIWPQLIGFARAKEYLMTGDLLTAEQAERIGLINHAVAPDQLDETVDVFAKRLANGATDAIRWTKMTTNIALKQLAHSIMDASMAYEALSNIHPRHLEAIEKIESQFASNSRRGG